MSRHFDTKYHKTKLSAVTRRMFTYKTLCLEPQLIHLPCIRYQLALDAYSRQSRYSYNNTYLVQNSSFATLTDMFVKSESYFINFVWKFQANLLKNIFLVPPISLISFSKLEYLIHLVVYIQSRIIWNHSVIIKAI